MVVSPQEYHERNGDIIFVPITSKQQPEGEDLKLENWEASGLLKPSWFKPLLATISAVFALQRLGQVTGNDRKRLRRTISTMLDDSVIKEQKVFAVT